MKAVCAPSASIAPPAPGAVAAKLYDIWIGGNSGSGPITVTSELCQLSCPATVHRDNWLTSDSYTDRFGISTEEFSDESGSWTSVSAIRMDVAGADLSTVSGIPPARFRYCGNINKNGRIWYSSGGTPFRQGGRPNWYRRFRCVLLLRPRSARAWRIRL
jgi:hypothetical protein